MYSYYIMSSEVSFGGAAGYPGRSGPPQVLVPYVEAFYGAPGDNHGRLHVPPSPGHAQQCNRRGQSPAVLRAGVAPLDTDVFFSLQGAPCTCPLYALPVLSPCTCPLYLPPLEYMLGQIGTAGDMADLPGFAHTCDFVSTCYHVDFRISASSSGIQAGCSFGRCTPCSFGSIATLPDNTRKLQ